MIKIKQGFILRKVGKEYLVVALGKAAQSFNGMIKMNETGTFYWKELGNGITKEELISKTLERFEDIDEKTASDDIEQFLKSIEIAVECDD